MSDNLRRDEAISALLAQLNTPTRDRGAGRTLWVADEHPLPEMLFERLQKCSGLFLSNRFDQYNLAAKRAIKSYFSDIDLGDTTQDSINQIFFRVAKERALVHRLINEAKRVLPANGSLWISGFKNEGIKTHIKRAEARFGCKAKVSRGKNQLFVAELIQPGTNTDMLPDNDYPVLRKVQCDESSFWSKPGLYGWNKEDLASKYLMDWLAEKPGALSGKSVLDLGCGYGYLSVRALEQQAQEVVATDNCAAALAACRKNLEGSAALAKVEPSDAGLSLSGKFSVILCNPPFHQGFSTTGDLHNRFIKETTRLLAPSGNAWYVVNQFLNIEKIAESTGLDAKEVSRTKSYKIIQMSVSA